MNDIQLFWPFRFAFGASLLGTLLHWDVPSHYLCVESVPPTREAFSFGICVNLARGCCSCAYLLPKKQPLALIGLRTTYMRMFVMQAARILKCTSAGLTYLPIVSVCLLTSWVGFGAPLGSGKLRPLKDYFYALLDVCIPLFGAGLSVGSHIACMVLSHTNARAHVDRSSANYSEQREAGVLGMLQLWLTLMVFLMSSHIVGVFFLCTASSVIVYYYYLLYMFNRIGMLVPQCAVPTIPLPPVLKASIAQGWGANPWICVMRS